VSLGDLVEHLDQLGMLICERGCASPYVVGQQQLAAGRGRDFDQRDVAGPLVGDGKVVNLFDGVAEEVHAYGMLLCRRKDIDDAAAYGELASPLDQVDTGIRRIDQGSRQLAQVDLLTDHEAYRSQVPKALDLRLQQAADRRDHDPRRGKITIAGQPPQQFEPAADGIGARAQPFVRKRLPRRVVGHCFLTKQ